VLVAVEKEEYATAIKNSPCLEELAGDKYSACLVRCIEIMAMWLDQNKLSGRVCYTFEAGCAYQAAANVILTKIGASQELKNRFHWHGYLFVEKDSSVPHLFASDLLAWEWNRAHTNATVPYPEWRTVPARLTGGTPHIIRYLTSDSLAARAIVNLFYGLTGKAIVCENAAHENTE
jgi:hypothetical protein